MTTIENIRIIKYACITQLYFVMTFFVEKIELGNHIFYTRNS